MFNIAKKIFIVFLTFTIIFNNFTLQQNKAHAFAFAGAVPAGITVAGGAYALGALALGSLAVGLGLEHGDEINKHAKDVWSYSSSMAQNSLQTGIQTAVDSGQFMVKTGTDFWDYASMKASDLAGRISAAVTSKELDENTTAVETTQDFGGNTEMTPVNVTTKHPSADFENYFFYKDYNAVGNHRFWYTVTFPQSEEKFFYATLSTEDINKKGAIYGFKSLQVSVSGVHSISIGIQNAVTELVDNPSSLHPDILYSFNSQELHDMLASAKTVEDVIGAVNYALTELDAPSYVDQVVVGNLNTYVTYQNALEKINQDLANYRNNGIGMPVAQAEPRTKTGEKLTYNEGTNTYTGADGSTYTGEVDYTLPQAVPKEIDGATVVTVPIDGSLVNIATGEIVGTAEPPTTTPPEGSTPTDPWGSNPFANFLPIAMLLAILDLLRAILWYCLRFIEFIVTIPLTPSVPIENPGFQWFRNARIMGVQIYDLILGAAAIGLSASVYKVIRRIF